MSNSVDQRIVQMEFDNAQFERGVGTTLASLKALDQNLQLKDGLSGLNNIEAAVANVNFSELVSDVNDLNDKFSVLGVIGFNAISRVTNAVMDLGIAMAKGLTVDPLTDGLEEYKLKMDSITTIMANTSHKGTTLDEVNETLAELNEYADQTIYNFAQMTRNIGTFTAAGIDLQTSATAIKGIANLAAVSGSNSQQAAVAMYQLSQALAAGKVKLMDWNSVVNAGMGGKVFQDALVRTSEHLQTGAQEAIDAEGSFRESLKAGWLTSEVLTETLSQFTMLGTEEERVHLQQMGYTEEEIAAVFQMGKTAQDAATKVKTFQQLVDTTKEALGSGWATSWEYIIGNMEQAQELWTGISEVINGVIDAMSKPRNDFLRTWNEEGGWQALKDTLFEIGGLISDLIQPLGDAFNAVFGEILDPIAGGKAAAEASKSLLETVKAMRAFIADSELARTAAFLMRTAFTALFTVIKVVGGVVGKVFVTAFKAVGLVLTTVVNVVENALQAFKGLREIIVGFVWDRIINPLSDFVTNVLKLETVGDIIHNLGGLFDAFFGIFAEGHSEAADAFKNSFLGALNENFARIAEKVGGALYTLGEGLSYVLSLLQSTAGRAAGVVFEKLQSIGERVLPILEGVRDRIINAWHFLQDAFINAGFSIDPFINMFKGFGEAFSKFFESVLSDGFSIDKVFDLFRDLGDNVKQFMEELGPAFESFASTVGSAINGEFSEAMASLQTWASNLEGPIGAIASALSGLVDSIASLGSSFKFPWDKTDASEGVDKMGGAVEKALSVFTTFDHAVSMLWNPFSTLHNFVVEGLSGLTSGIDDLINSLNGPDLSAALDKLGDLAILGGVGASLYAFFNLTSSLSGVARQANRVLQLVGNGLSNLNDMLKAAKTAMYASTLVSIAVAIGILVAALFALTQMDLAKVQEAMPILGEIALGIVGVMLGFALAGRIAEVNAATIAAMSGLIFSMVAVIAGIALLTTILGILPEEIISRGEATLSHIFDMLTFLILALGVVAKASRGNATAAAAVMAELVAAVTILSGLIILLGAMPESYIEQGMGVVAGIATVLAVLVTIITVYGKGLGAGAAGLLELAAAVAVIAVAIAMLTHADPANLQGASFAIAGMILVLLAFVKVVSSINPVGFQEAAVSLIILSAAVVLLAGALVGLSMVAALGGDIVAGMAALVVIIGGLSIAAIALALAGPNMIAGARSLLVVAGAVTLLSAVLIVFSTMNTQELWTSIVQLGIVLLIATAAFGAIAAISYYAAPGLAALGAVLTALGIMMIGFGVGVLAFAAAITMLSQITPEGVDNIINAIQRLGQGIWDSKEEIAMGIAGLGLGITAGIAAAIPGIVAVTALLIGALIGVLITSGPLIGESCVQVVAAIIDGFATGLEEHGQDILDAFAHLIEVVKAGMHDLLVSGFDEINAWVYDNFGWLGMGVPPQAKEAADQTVAAYSGTLKDGASEVSAASNEVKNAALDPLKEGSTEANQISMETMQQICDTMGVPIPMGEIDTSFFEASGIDINGIATSMGYDGVDSLATSWNTYIGQTNLDVTPATDQVEAEMAAEGPQAVDAYAEAAESEAASTDLSASMTGMITNSIDLGSVASSGASAAMTYATSFLSTLDLDPTPAVEEAVGALQDEPAFRGATEADALAGTEGLESGVAGMSDVMRSAVSSSISAVSSLTGYAFSESSYIGNAMGSGLAAGIRAMIGEVLSAAAGLVSAALSSMSIVGEIRSPSRATKRLGRYMAEGFALGMSENVNMSEKAAKSLVNSAMDSMVSQASYLLGMLDEIEDQPVITPVLDLSQVESGVGAIDGMMTQSQFLAASAIQGGILARASMDAGTSISTNAPTYNFNLDYSSGDDAVTMFMELASMMQSFNRLEA